MFLDAFHPLLAGLGTFVRLAEELSLPLIQASQEFFTSAANSKVAPLVSFDFVAYPANLAGMQCNLRSPSDKGFTESGSQFFLFGQLHHVCREAVKVCALVAKWHGARVGFQGLNDVVP